MSGQQGTTALDPRLALDLGPLTVTGSREDHSVERQRDDGDFKNRHMSVDLVE
jgi:hypothetical protein